MDGEELTEQETQLYDRQIRVWGADAQRRLSKAHVLVCGMKGAVAEFCKNVVLAGIGSLTLVDNRLVTEEALSANFLIPPDESVFGGKTVAELCCDSLKDFNPMVRVSVVKGEPSSFDEEFLKTFDVIVVSCCSLAEKKSVNEKCRKLPKRISFYTVDCRDSYGEIFVDLQDYKYAKKKLEDTVECQLSYPSFEEAISVRWKAHPRKVSKLFYALRESRTVIFVSIPALNSNHLYPVELFFPHVLCPDYSNSGFLMGAVIERFEEAEGRNPGETSISDLPGVLKLKKDLCESQSLNEAHIPNVLLERLVTNPTEFPPVCAIIGGILGQEVIKAISGKGDPLKNFFYFDAVDGKGIIEDISSQP
ncbi:SUMO-activating enzyme subunit 1B-1-like isoform X2 [Benincasa hispida]|uniref:SUMO-activating enzyme subunit 1B-1-like isoform X2 n=1 Tax=Benincasa hispida TaxID=102211 RepID=UPI0019008927|nr:SUMO-activating enzyme subunit 1B-1-like isoform X2 [Benincasa hispida]